MIPEHRMFGENIVNPQRVHLHFLPVYRKNSKRLSMIKFCFFNERTIHKQHRDEYKFDLFGYLNIKSSMYSKVWLSIAKYLKCKV